ncbi:hypothetical protein BDV3_004531 [Batrachochytrium dendrobatidis]|uniref:PXA domain-containing protein n=1 Tax=Batrachochytrium dendrobatidis (strain JEL423) TaxID=403673 RepID=A0A177WHZ5_BATDL|nr:hypothetical protein BDEG_23002 [Batrachochytrium dendrobatidis JEL423]
MSDPLPLRIVSPVQALQSKPTYNANANAALAAPAMTISTAASSSVNVPSKSINSPVTTDEGSHSLPNKDSKTLPSRAFSTTTLNQIFNQIRPHQFTSSCMVDSEIQKLITLLLRDYVASWFSIISDNDEFITELIRTISHVIRECERRLNRVDFVALACRDLPEILQRHISDYRLCCEKMGTSYAGGRSLEELFHGCQPHIALNDTASESEYLRGVAEILLDTLLPETEHRSESVRYLLREILTNNVLAMLLNILSEPDYLNLLFLNLFETDNLEESPTSDNLHYSANSPKINIESPTKSSMFNDLYGTGLTSDETDIGLACGSDAENEGAANSILFQVQAPNNLFVKRRKARQQNPPHETKNSFVKFTMGGLEKMTSSIDKFKNLVTARDQDMETGADRQSTRYGKQSDRRIQKKKLKASETDREFEGYATSSNSAAIAFGKDSNSTNLSKSSMKLQNDGSSSNKLNSDLLTPQYDGRRLSDGVSLGHYESGASDSDTIPPLLQKSQQNRLQNKGLVQKQYQEPMLTCVEQSEQDQQLQPRGDYKSYYTSTNGVSLAQINTDPTRIEDKLVKDEGVWTKLYAQLQDVWKYGCALYHETRFGPWHLGPIDTTKYDRQYLEEPIMDLLNEAFQIQTHQRWVFTQIMFFAKPILHSVAAPLVNRLIMKGIYFLICEEQITFYLLLLRTAFWPDNIPAPSTYSVRSEREKNESKQELEARLIAMISPLCAPLLGQQLAEDKTRFLFNVFQNKTINKHLIFVVVDLFLAHFAPEYAETRVTND